MASGREANKIIGWKAIAEYLGMSEAGAKMMFRRAGVTLSKTGTNGRTSRVYLLKSQLFSNALSRGLSGGRGAVFGPH